MWSRTRSGGREGRGATVAITAILFHRLSFIKPDKLLKELLSDCCWYAARKQPSVSVSESIALLSCARGEEGRQREAGSERQRAAAVDVAVDGSLDFLHVNSPGGEVLYITKPSAPLSPSVQRQIRHCSYMNSAGHFPWGALPGIEIMKNSTPGCCFIQRRTGRAKVSGIN